MNVTWNSKAIFFSDKYFEDDFSDFQYIKHKKTI